jgi:DNA-3-methyladenine glycosylase
VKLSKEFFEQKTLKVAKELLGKILCVRKNEKILRGIIVETEAYRGEDDLACHASKGRTKRTETLYKKAGTVYAYLIYGMHYCLNIVTEKENYPSAVLIRGVTVEENRRIKTISGPGRVCRHFGVDKTFNGLDVFGKNIWVEDGGLKISPRKILKSKRIGVDYAKHCKDYLWRFNVDLK